MPDNRQKRSVWCPTCDSAVALPDQTMIVEFSPQSWTVHPDGSLDTGWGFDVFMDLSHMSCGTTMRLAAHTSWSEEAGAYVEPEKPFMVELDWPGADGEPMSEVVVEDPRWDETFRALLETWKEALAKLKERLQ